MPGRIHFLLRELYFANICFIFVPLSSNGLSCGVMVTQQILVLSFWVRIPAAQRSLRNRTGPEKKRKGIDASAGCPSFRSFGYRPLPEKLLREIYFRFWPPASVEADAAVSEVSDEFSRRDFSSRPQEVEASILPDSKSMASRFCSSAEPASVLFSDWFIV